jgi:hypothetical protein
MEQVVVGTVTTPEVQTADSQVNVAEEEVAVKDN